MRQFTFQFYWFFLKLVTWSWRCKQHFHATPYRWHLLLEGFHWYLTTLFLYTPHTLACLNLWTTLCGRKWGSQMRWEMLTYLRFYQLNGGGLLSPTGPLWRGYLMTLSSRRWIPEFLLLIAGRNRLLEGRMRIWSPRVGPVLASCSPIGSKLAKVIVWGTSTDPFILVLWFPWNAWQCRAWCGSCVLAEPGCWRLWCYWPAC